MTVEVKVMKRKSCVMGLMFNLECSFHCALHSTGHKEEGIGVRRTLQSIFCGDVSLGVVLRLRTVLRHGEGKCYGKLKIEPGLEPALLLPRPVVFPFFHTGVSSAISVLQRGGDYREGLTLGARSPVVFSNNNSFCGIQLQWTSTQH